MLIELKRVEDLLARCKGATVGLIGDFCLDAYWTLEPDSTERSVETGKLVNRVIEQRYSLGGAGNVAANLAALGVGALRVFGMRGDDVFGREMAAQLAALGADCSGMLVSPDWATSVFSKPHLSGVEGERFDFGSVNRIRPEMEAALLEQLKAALPSLDVLLINQQLPGSYLTDTMARELSALASEASAPFLVDSRDRMADLAHVILKLNAHEAAKTCGDVRDMNDTAPLEDLRVYGDAIRAKTGRPLFITRGRRGMLVCEEEATTEIPGIQAMKATDPVGAGDTAFSALGAALASGASFPEAAAMANMASTVTVQKLRQTGTASPEELLAIARDTNYIYRPELSEDPRKARMLEGTGIELVDDTFEKGRIAHAVFDHDGTISTLREGWEAVMEKVMIRAILGPAFETASEEDYRRVRDASLAYIDQSTGIQTILQMQALAEMVADFGFVPKEDILDAPGYKEVYNDALMAVIRTRTERVSRGELTVSDWTVKGAVDFLRELKGRGVTLYLASGTDEADVQEEAALLGYAGLFEGGIFGAVGDVTKYSKKMVLERIVRENGLHGPELAVFGDGPVELREAKKQAGIAVGIASDEVRRFGLNVEKRTRLIQAGADIVAPDFSQPRPLLACLFGVE